MAKRVILPPEALDDVSTLLRLSPDQLRALDELFSKGESAHPLRATFINKVAETLKVDIEDARSVVVVCHVLLHRIEAQDDEEFVSDLLEDTREFLEKSLSDDEKKSILSSFEENYEILKSLATPKPAPLRAEKIRRLRGGPEQQIDSIRTICQLRPLFEGAEDDEKLAGLVPQVLLEIECTDADDNSRTLVFGIAEEDLADLEKVVKRTKEKLRAIREKYDSELLTTD